MALPDLSGATLGQYHVEELLGEGEVGVVYLATQQPSDQPVALKVLDPGLAARPGFMRRFVSQTATISKLAHPGIVPVYEIGTRAQLTYLSMRLVRGGTLRDLLLAGTLDAGSVWRMLRGIADALHSAHEVGVVHQDLKPSNVLIESDGTVLLTDFGLARINYGYALGTPGYMSPEQAMGLEIDRRSDVHALGLLAFEMLTGTRPYLAGSAVDLILATAHDPVPSARSLNPSLPPELDVVLFRALAKEPGDRQDSVVALLSELSQVPMGPSVVTPGRGLGPGPILVGRNAMPITISGIPGSAGWGADYQLVTLFEASLDPVIAIDEQGLVTHWNTQAEQLFGWSRKQIVGLPILTTLVAPRYREMLERVFATFLAHKAQQESQAVEVVGMHREGRAIPLELSLSLVRLGPTKANVVAFCRDISERKESERLRALQDVVGDAIADAQAAGPLAKRVLDLCCSHLDWPVGVLWTTDADGTLRCAQFHSTGAVALGDLEALTRQATYARGSGVPGRVLASGEPAWHDELVRVAESGRELSALRAGLLSAGAFPVQDEDHVIGVLEFFATATGPIGAPRTTRLEGIGRRLGRTLARLGGVAAPGSPGTISPPPAGPAVDRRPASTRRSRNGAGTRVPSPAPRDARAAPAPAEAPPEEPAAGGRTRYRIDPRHSHIEFSCAFMKFLTVHGHFKDFRGWVEVDGEDPAGATVECSIKTASVDTGSLDRDYHLCSEDFFAVESYPDMVFRGTGVDVRGDERYRLRGELTIRNVTRPVTLDVRLAEREQDGTEERATLTASTVIDRTDWFLDWEEALEAGRWIVGEQIRVDLEVALVHRTDAAGGAD